MKTRCAALMVLVTLIFGLTACDVLSEGDMGVFLEELAEAYPIRDLEKPLSESEDPDVQAAGEVNTVIKREREARELLQEALESKDPQAIDKAIGLRPQDATYYAYSAAMRFALEGLSTDFWESLKTVYGLHSTNGNASLDTEGEILAAGHLLSAGLEVRNLFSPDSEEWERAHSFVCEGREALQASDEPLAPVVLALNPDSAVCP